MDFIVNYYVSFPDEYPLSPFLHYGLIAAMCVVCVLTFLLLLGGYGVHKNNEYAEDRPNWGAGEETRKGKVAGVSDATHSTGTAAR